MNTIILDNVRDKILDLVEGINPHDLLEKQHINDTVAWIKNGEQIFRITKPDNPNKHLVSYFVQIHRSLHGYNIQIYPYQIHL